MRQKMFSTQRFQLFIHNQQNQNQNLKISQSKSDKNLVSIISNQRTQYRQQLHELICKKQAEIKDLKKKLKAYQTQISIKNNLICTKQYQINFFKKKISEQCQKSKQLEEIISQINRKLFQLIKNLSIVEKIKNPVENTRENADINSYNEKQQVNKYKNLEKVSGLPKNIFNLEKYIIKVCQVISAALNLKSQKKKLQKNSSHVIPIQTPQFQTQSNKKL